MQLYCTHHTHTHEGAHAAELLKKSTVLCCRHRVGVDPVIVSQSQFAFTVAFVVAPTALLQTGASLQVDRSGVDVCITLYISDYVVLLSAQ